MIIHDLEEGMITPESAIRDYGMTEADLKAVRIYQQ